MRVASLKIHKEKFAFSAGHFTLFSATEREPLHGHNYNVSIGFRKILSAYGLSFDYRHYKKKMQLLCDQLNNHFLLPGQSPWLSLQEEEDYWIAHFNHQKIPFLKADVLILPLTNITLEELSHWFLQKMLDNPAELESHGIFSITIKVYNGCQSGGAHWEKNTA